MDEQTLQALQQRGQQQAPQGPGAGSPPQPDQGGADGGGEPFSLGSQFDGNPFESLGGGGGSPGQDQSAGQVSPQPQQQEQPQMTPEMMKAVGMDPTQDQTVRGSNPGGSKFLLGALQQLQGYIGESQDRDEIAIARSLMQLITKLIDRDQTSQSDKLAAGGDQAQPGGAPTPQPAPGAGAVQGGQQ